MKKASKNDLGFSFKITKGGDLEIRHRGKYAAKINGSKGNLTISKLEIASFIEQQELMARLTGNYKRGNERLAKNHPKNKR